MAEKYEIVISSKDTSDPKSADKIRDPLKNPISAIKNQDEIRKDISEFAGGNVSQRTRTDEAFLGQALRQLGSYVNTAATGINPPKSTTSKDNSAKEIGDAADKLGDAADKLGDAADKLDRESTEDSSSNVGGKGGRKSKVTKTNTPTADPFAFYTPEDEGEFFDVPPKGKPPKKKKTKTPITPVVPESTPGEDKSSVESSGAAIKQIKADFVKFKSKLVDTLKTRLAESSGDEFQLIGKGKGAYTRRGDSDVLQIADMNKLISALRELGISAKESSSLAKKGPKAMIGAAKSAMATQVVASQGPPSTESLQSLLKNVATDINKKGYTGADKNIQKLVREQAIKEKDVPVKDRQGIDVQQLAKVLKDTAVKKSGGYKDDSTVPEQKDFSKKYETNLNKTLGNLFVDTIAKSDFSGIMKGTVQKISVPTPETVPKDRPGVYRGLLASLGKRTNIGTGFEELKSFGEKIRQAFTGKIPTTTTTSPVPSTRIPENKTLIESSGALMNQIKNDFVKFKVKFADTIRSRLDIEHGGNVKVIGDRGKEYTRRGGTEVLKIANMKELVGALLKLTNSNVDYVSKLEKQGPEAMVAAASTHVVENMLPSMGNTAEKQTSTVVSGIAKYVNKHGYEGESEALKDLVAKQTEKEKNIPLNERKGISSEQVKTTLDAESTKLNKFMGIQVMAETIGKEEISRTIGGAIKEVVIPRPVESPQGFPAIQLPTGRQRALAPEYEFKPGIMVGSELASAIVKAGGKGLPRKDVTDRVKKQAPNVRQMLLRGEDAKIASHAGDVMSVLKTDKKGRLELINAYKNVLGAKGVKTTSKVPPSKMGKKGQLIYLEKLATDAKRLSLGFDDVLVAMGKLTKSGIYDRLLGSVTAESGGKTSNVRTTMKNLFTDDQAIDKFNKRIKEPFTAQALLDPYKPRQAHYQSHAVKLTSPRLTEGKSDDFVSAVDTRASLSALNKQTEMFLDLKKGVPGYPEKLTSKGIAEAPLVDVKPDPRDPKKVISNMFTEDINSMMALGIYRNQGRNPASTYQGLGGGEGVGGVMTGGLERPFLKSHKSKQLEESGMWGKGGYGQNLQTVIRDTTGTFEDQVEVSGKALNRFSEYIKPQIMDVTDVDSATLAAKNIVGTMAPVVGEQLKMKAPGAEASNKTLISEISKILTSSTGASLEKRAVSVMERVFTTLGTKLTTSAMSKGTVTFKSGKEGELGYSERPTFTHDLMSQMLEKKKSGGKKPTKQDKQIDGMLADLQEVGTAPFIGFMHRELSTEVQARFKRIKNAVLKMLDIDSKLKDEGLVNEINKKAKTSLGDKSLITRIPNEVRMSLSGAMRRLNVNEPLEAIYNNIAGNVDAVAPNKADLGPDGEVSRVLKAMGYTSGPENKQTGFTLPGYVKQSEGPDAIAGSKFWQTTRNAGQEAEWEHGDILSGRKGQRMNIAAMGALTSMFGENSLVTQSAEKGYLPDTNKSIETMMALRSFGEKSQTNIPDEAMFDTKGLKELPKTIETYKDLRNTILDPKYGAGGYANIPEFDKGGKEIGSKPLYVPSREVLNTYETEGGGLGANTLATRYGSLLANAEKYKQTKERTYLDTDRPDTDIVRKNVSKEVGMSVSNFGKQIGEVFKDKSKKGLGKDETGALLEFLHKLETILDKMSGAESAILPGLDKNIISGEVDKVKAFAKGGTISKFGGNLGQTKDLLMKFKDILIEPRVDTSNIERVQKDIKLLEGGGKFADMSEKSYMYYKSDAVRRTTRYEKINKGKEQPVSQYGEESFEKESGGARSRILAGLKEYEERISYGVKNKKGVLSISPESLMEGAKQFGVTTDPKQQALEETRKNIERDKRRLGEELFDSTVGKKKGVDTLQTRMVPAIRGQMHAALNDKVQDFKEAINIINSLGDILQDTGISSHVQTIADSHKKELEKEVGQGAIALREGEVGLHPAKIEKLTGEYGKDQTALDYIRSGKDITATTTRYPYTGLSSTQFAKVRESKHPKSRDVISVAGGTIPGVDMPKLEEEIGKLRTARTRIRTQRGGLAEAAPGTRESRNLDLERRKLTSHITKLTRAIDLLETKFHGYAQNADFDGDNINVHAEKTKKAAQELEGVAKGYSKGTFGAGGAQDPRAFINKMMSYKALGLKSSMAELADVYSQKSGIPGAKLFQTPDITKKLENMSTKDVSEGLVSFGITASKLKETVESKGLGGSPEATQTVARGLLYDKIKEQQYGKTYVKAGLGESTESINKLARLLDASVGFGDKKLGKKEYSGWKEDSVALGAVYGKGGKLEQKAKPAREMQTMMNYMLNTVINSGMGAKHGGKAMFEDVSKGLASGTLFSTIKKDPKRFKGILETNEIIKQTIRDRLDALNTVDFAAEAKRHKTFGKNRGDITGELVKKFSFEGFVGDMSEDVKSQMMGAMVQRRMDKSGAKTEPEKAIALEKAKKGAQQEFKRKLGTGKLNISSYFKEMQPAYSLRSSSASVDSLSKQADKGTNKLDAAMSQVLKIIQSSGKGGGLSGTLMQGAFRNLFNMFDQAERLGVNLNKAFSKGKSLKQKEKIVGGLESKLGVTKMSSAEKKMLAEEGGEIFKRDEPEGTEEDLENAKRKHVLKYRQKAVKRHVASIGHKKDLLSRVVPDIGAAYGIYSGKGGEEMPPSSTFPSEQGRMSAFMGVSRIEQTADVGNIASAFNIEKKMRRIRELARNKAKREGLKYVPFVRTPKIYDKFSEPETSSYFQSNRNVPISSRQDFTKAKTQAQTWEEVRQTDKGTGDPGSTELGKVGEIDYSAFGKGSVKEFVKTLEKYRKVLRLLSEGNVQLTEQQTQQAKQALEFIERHASDLGRIPSGAKGHKAASDIVSLSDKIKGAKTTTKTGTLSEKAEIPPDLLPFMGSKKAYGSDLEALIGLTARAENATRFSPAGMPDEIVDALTGIRTKKITPHQGADILMENMGKVPERRSSSVWKQYHVEKVKSEIIKAQEADAAGDYATKERSILNAKDKIVGTYQSKLTPFLTRAQRGYGRVTGHVDEDAVERLGIKALGPKKKDILEKVAGESTTAADAIEPLLLGTGRMEERLKKTWAILRNFSPEMAKAGEFAKAFNFGTAKKDIAIIRDGLSLLQKSGGQMEAEEYADLEHALKKTKQMQTALQEPDEKKLPTLALKNLESKETAEAAFENLQSKVMDEMMGEAGISVAAGTKRKVSMVIPTSEGLEEKRTVTLMAKGSELEGAAGKVTRVEKVDEKSTKIDKAYTPSMRAVRLLDRFNQSTSSINEKVKNVYLGIKRFSTVTGKVNFDEALTDLRDLRILLEDVLHMPGLTSEKKMELGHLKKKVGSAYSTLSETPPEAMPGVIMKGMESKQSAEAAFENKKELMRKQMLAAEDLEVGMSANVAATIPTKQGPEKRKVRMVAVGDDAGVVTGIEEEKYKSKKEFVDDLTKGKTSRASIMFKGLSKATGDVHSRISAMVLGMKKFDLAAVKAGKHTESVNFDTAEADLTEMISLINMVLNGAVSLTDQEKEMYTVSKAAAKEMRTKITKTPIAGLGGLTMGGYETAQSSLAAYMSKIKAAEIELIKFGKLGKTAVVTGKVLTESGQEVTRKTQITARGDKWFGYGGQVSRTARKEEPTGGQGQVSSVVRRVALWGSASGAIYGIIGGVKQMIETAKVAEVGMTNLKKVMPSIGTDFDKMRDSAIDFAKTYGAELKGVLETMRIFAQQGLSQPKVLEMARVSTLASNVTTMDPTKSAEALTSATRQFNVEGENSIAILDSWNEVENKFAITASDLADGFKKSATAARIAGFDMHELNGIITAIGESTRQTGKEVGTSLKFIFSRMGTEKAPKALAAVGVQTTLGGERRRGSEVLSDLHDKWGNLTDAQKLSTAQAIGGIRHYNALMVLMENYSRAVDATTASITSAGSAERENKMVMQTYEKQLAQTKASFDALAVSAGGPILGALKVFTSALKGVIDVVAMIPSGGLSTLAMGSYAAAVGLGKYFDLSMFGLMGERGAGGEKRSKRGFGELATAAKGSIGKKAKVGERVLDAGVMASMFGRLDKAEQTKIKPVVPTKTISSLSKVKGIFRGIVPAAKTASLAVLGFIASLGPLALIALGLAAVGAAFWGINAAVSASFSNAEGRTKKYAKTLGIVENTLIKLGETGRGSQAIKTSTKEIASLIGKPVRSEGETEEDFRKRQAAALNRATDTKQVTARVMEGHYKSPVLLQKKQQTQIESYSNTIATLTTTGSFGFDKFGNAVTATANELNGVVDVLKDVATESKIDLKLHVIKEELKDLAESPEIDSVGKAIAKSIRDGLRSFGKLFGASWQEGNLNTHEKLVEATDKASMMRRKAAGEGREIAPPRSVPISLEKTDPKEYKKQVKENKKKQKEYEEYISTTTDISSYRKEYDAGMAKAKQNFQSLGQGLDYKFAAQAAYSETGSRMATMEAERSPFYKTKGITPEEVQASYLHKRMGAEAAGPTAELTRARAMEQGIMPKALGTGVERQEMLEGVKARDMILAKKGAEFEDMSGKFGIVGDQIQVYKGGIDDNGALMVAYVKRAADEAKPFKQTAEEFIKIHGASQGLSDIVSTVGMITENAQKLRDISIVTTGGEAGMFRPTADKKLDLGKKYKFQTDTGMLMQNNAFDSFSKDTEDFVTEYTKLQSRVRKEKKDILSSHKSKGTDIAAADADRLRGLSESLAGVANTAMQVTRASTELEKSLSSMTLRFKEQTAVNAVRRETRMKTSGLLAGMSEIKAPQIDTRKFSELSPHDRLRATSPEYEKNLVASDKQLNMYNQAIKEAEVAAKVVADISFVKGEAVSSNLTQDETDKLIDSVTMTGSKETGPLLNEMTTQTVLQQQMARCLESINTVTTKGGSASLLLAKKAVESKESLSPLNKINSLWGEGATFYQSMSSEFARNQELEKSASRQISFDVGSKFADSKRTGDFSSISNYVKQLEGVTNTKYSKDEATKASMEALGGDKELLKKVLTDAGMSQKEYEKSSKKGKLGEAFFDKFEIIMGNFAKSGIPKPEFGLTRKPGVSDREPNVVEKLAKKTLITQEEKANQILIEKKAKAKDAHGALVETYAEMEGSLRAMKGFMSVVGELEKAIENLSVAFLKLEKQSAVNKALIDTRSQYMNVRGGPIKRQAPAVNIDAGTSASQYRPHQILYDKSSQYRDATTDYLNNMEDVKSSRSKLETLAKIRGQKEFLESQPGAKSEDVDAFLTSAMKTGNVELAPLLTELSKIADNTSQTAENTLSLEKGKKTDTDTTKKQSAEVMMEKSRLQAKSENEVAEKRASAGADYLRKEQIKLQTVKDVAAGRGMSQDQVNREENIFRATTGFVPPEIKARNEQLRAVYEKEKKARADFELAKQKELKPLQESSSGMSSIISSIQTGVAGIKGSRNVRPLQENLEKWSKNRTKERVAEQQGQFGLAQSVYSQNLNLRSQQIDTGVTPRELYNIMKRASKGDDVTDELQSIEKRLAEAKEKKDDQIRKIQAQEYATAMTNSTGTKQTNTSLDAIDKNTKSMIGAVNEGNKTIADAIVSGNSETAAALQAMAASGGETVTKSAEPLTTKEIKNKESIQAFKDTGTVTYEGSSVPTMEEKASRVYTGAYGGDITSTPTEEYEFGVPVGQDSAYAFAERASSGVSNPKVDDEHAKMEQYNIEKLGGAGGIKVDDEYAKMEQYNIEKLGGAGGIKVDDEHAKMEQYNIEKLGGAGGSAESLVDKEIIPIAEKTITPDKYAMPFTEKVKPYAPAVFGQEDYLLASDKRKPQMAAAMSFEEKAKPFVKTDFGYGAALKEASKTDEQIKKEEMIKSAAKGGLTMTLPKEGESVAEFAERTKSPEQKSEDAARKDLALNYRKDRPVDSYDVLKAEFTKEPEFEQDEEAEVKRRKAARPYNSNGPTAVSPDVYDRWVREDARVREFDSLQDSKDRGLSEEETEIRRREAARPYDPNETTVVSPDVHDRWQKEDAEAREFYAKKKKLAEPEKGDKKSENLKKETLNKDIKQNDFSRKESKDLSDKTSDLKDEMESFKSTVSKVNEALKDLSDSIKNVNDLGDASKDSAASVESLGSAADSASSSLDTLASNKGSVDSSSGPTMEDKLEDFNFISEEDAVELIGSTKDELLENINSKVDNTDTVNALWEKVDLMKENIEGRVDNTDTINELCNKTDALNNDINSMKENILSIPFGVSEEDFIAFKEKASSYFENVNKITDIEVVVSELTSDIDTLANKISSTEKDTTTEEYDYVSSEDFESFKSEVLNYNGTVEELKILTDNLTITSETHSNSIRDIETSFSLVENKLIEHSSKFTKIEENLDTIDHKFTNWIENLQEDVATAIDLARSAYSMATQG